MCSSPSSEPTVRELAPAETGLAFVAMHALRPALADEAAFVARVEAQRADGYRLVAGFDAAGGTVMAVAGFRIGHSLAWGRHLYVDDLSTLPEARGRGHGGRIMRWLIGEARRLGCEQLHLDSGVGAQRTDAHRLYFNSGLAITSHHFVRVLAAGG